MTTDLLANGLSAVFGTSTSVTLSHKVPFFDGTTPAGLATMSDLASVLGATIYKGKLNENNTIRDAGMGCYIIDYGHYPTDCPFNNVSAFVFVYVAGDQKSIRIETTDNRIFFAQKRGSSAYNIREL